MEHLRWFRRLVRLLPEEFRAVYGRDMERTFDAQHRDAARERRGTARLWFETVRDLLRTAPRQHVEQLRQDVHYASRTMIRRPGFSLVATLVFAIGIAATTAVFSVVQAALLAPVPFDAPDRLVAIREIAPQDPRPWELSYPAYVDLRSQVASLRHVAAHMRNGIAIGGPEPLLTNAALVSASLFETLRVRPLAGRAFLESEDTPGGPNVAIVRRDFAQARFGSVERAVGSALIVDDRPATVVGIMPDTFRYPEPDAQVWLPIGQLSGEPWMRNRAVHVALVVARVRDGVALDEARGEVEAWAEARQAHDPTADPGHRVVVRPLAEQVSAGARPAVTALAGAVVLLLVVTCSSVALLLLTRAASRSSEVSIRLSLGASRPRIARQLMTEAICLALLGATAGIGAARLLVAFLVRGLADALPPLVEPRIDGRVMLVAVLTATASAAVCGLVPAARAVQAVRAAPRQQRSRRTLVATQVAISCVLLVLAALLGRSLDRLLRVEMGFRADQLLTMRVTAPLAMGSTPGGMTRFYQTALSRLRALPGVEAVTATNRPPVQEGGQADLTVEGRPQRVAPLATFRRVLPGYFATLGVPVLEGRDFDERDGTGEPVVIVSRALARRMWPASQAVGKRIKVGVPEHERWLRIVGVVGDVRNRTLDDEAPDLATYEPHRQRPWNGMIIMIRTAGAPTAMIDVVRRALRQVEPQAIVSDVGTMDERIEETVASRRFHATVVGAFALATLLLVALALYGVLAFSVALRTREIGIRSALGAPTAVLRRGVLIEGVRPAVIGVIVGLLGGAAIARAVRPLLFDVTPADGPTYAATAAIMLSVATVASWFPARRAARIDPASALRAD